MYLLCANDCKIKHIFVICVLLPRHKEENSSTLEKTAKEILEHVDDDEILNTEVNIITFINSNPSFLVSLLCLSSFALLHFVFNIFSLN